MINDIVTVLETVGVTTNQENAYCYRKLSKDPDYCHIELYGFTHFPIKIKTAYAEDMSSNQAERYVTQISRMRDEVFFIYNGLGWNKRNYKQALKDIKSEIGIDHVFHLQEFKIWLENILGETL